MAVFNLLLGKGRGVSLLGKDTTALPAVCMCVRAGSCGDHWGLFVGGEHPLGARPGLKKDPGEGAVVSVLGAAPMGRGFTFWHVTPPPGCCGNWGFV